MKRVVNGELIAATPDMEVLPPGGTGVFETVLLRGSAPVFLDDHWSRFAKGCEWHRFVPPMSVDKMRQVIATLATDNTVIDGVVRFAAWKSGNGVEWRVEVGPPRPHMARPEFRIELGPRLPAATPDRAFKHLRRTAWLEALSAARVRGFDEAVLKDVTGNVVEGCVSNVFWIEDGVLYTPEVEAGPLPGVMRERVITLARDAGIDVRMGSYQVSVLQRASEIWMSNSLIGVRPVAEYGKRALTGLWPVLQRFRAAWQSTYGWDPVVILPAR